MKKLLIWCCVPLVVIGCLCAKIAMWHNIKVMLNSMYARLMRDPSARLTRRLVGEITPFAVFGLLVWNFCIYGFILYRLLR